MTISLLLVSVLAKDGNEDVTVIHDDTGLTAAQSGENDDVGASEGMDDDVSYAENGDENIKYDVSKSKTATQPNQRTWTSKVTLSLPSVEENLAADVVFVLDGASSAETGVVKESLHLLEKLKESASGSGAAVNVCIVKFKRQAFKSDWYKLATNFDGIEAAMEAKCSGGTNVHAGLLAGKEALGEHPNVSAGRKYLILISDGSTYLYSKDGN